MRVLFVNERCAWFGGVEANVAQTAAALRRRGHRCDLAFAPGGSPDEKSYGCIFDACVTWRRPDPGGRPGGALEPAAAMRPDVVYLHKVPETDLEAFLLPGVRTVRMVHDHDPCCPRRHKYLRGSGRVCTHPAGWRCWLDLAFMARDPDAACGLRWVDLNRQRHGLRQHAQLDAVLAGSRFVRADLLRNGLCRDRVHLLPLAVPAPGRMPVPTPREPRVLFVGQLLRGKGVDLLLRALALVRGPFEARIVGRGNARPALESLCARLGLDDLVQFTGWCEPQKMHEHFAWARVVAVPSRWPEPFGLVGLEAMHYARPVAAFRVGGIPDWLEDGVNGALVPEQDVEGLAGAIGHLLHTPELAETMGQAALRRVRQQFDFASYVDRLETVLSGVGRGARHAASRARTPREPSESPIGDTVT